MTKNAIDSIQDFVIYFIFKFHARQVLIQLLKARCTGDDAANILTPQNPGDRQLSSCCVQIACDFRE